MSVSLMIYSTFKVNKLHNFRGAMGNFTTTVQAKTELKQRKTVVNRMCLRLVQLLLMFILPSVAAQPMDKATKQSIRLMPQAIKQVKSSAVIDEVNWSSIAPLVGRDQVMTGAFFKTGGKIVGGPDRLTRFSQGKYLFTSKDWLVASNAPFQQITIEHPKNPAKEQFTVYQKQHTIYGMDNQHLGMYVKHVANAQLSDVKQMPELSITDKQLGMLEITASNQEITLSDRLFVDSGINPVGSSKQISIADEQRGYIVDSVSPGRVWSQHDVVMLDLGAKETKPGMIFGIYQAADVFTLNEHSKSTWQSPLLKQGDLIVLATFELVSFAVILNADSHITRGARVLAP